MKTIAEARRALKKGGRTVAGWSRERGYSQQLVYYVLSGKSKATYGECHRIAVELGLKEDE